MPNDFTKVGLVSNHTKQIVTLLADGYAVKELLKLINSLVECGQHETGDFSSSNLAKLTEPTMKQAALRDLRERVMQLTRTGATLHESLGVDIRCRRDRHIAASNQLELGEIEKALKEGIKAADKITAESVKRLATAGDDEKTIETRIEKKHKDTGVWQTGQLTNHV